MLKTCFKCNVSKPPDEFYDHPAMTDGKLGKCKECAKADVRKHRRDNPQLISAYEKIRREFPERKKAKVESQKRQREAHPERAKAYRAVNRAIRNGTLKREPCQYCGDPNTEAHHDDYSKPVEVVWACFECHRSKIHGHKVVVTRKAS